MASFAAACRLSARLTARQLRQDATARGKKDQLYKDLFTDNDEQVSGLLRRVSLLTISLCRHFLLQ